MSKLCRICKTRNKRACYASGENECNPEINVSFDDVYDIDFNSYLETFLSDSND